MNLDQLLTQMNKPVDDKGFSEQTVAKFRRRRLLSLVPVSEITIGALALVLFSAGDSSQFLLGAINYSSSLLSEVTNLSSTAVIILGVTIALVIEFGDETYQGVDRISQSGR